jgi:uncharacterized damage-inducible protein DinB
MPQTKLLAPVRAQRGKTVELLDSLSEDDLHRVHKPSGWTVAQLFAHIAAAELGSAFFIRRAKDGDTIEMDLASRDQFNALEVEKASRMDLGLLLAELGDSATTLSEVFEELDVHDLDKAIVWPEWPAKTIKDSIQYMARHEAEHCTMIEEAVAAKKHPTKL